MKNVIGFTKKFFTSKKNGGGKEIFTELGLTLVGLAVLYVFRDAIIPLVQTLITLVGDKVTAVFK